MKINEVEAAVGVTKKNIRFYEEEGLISPSREPGNGYRSYSQADVERLRRIKLLRKLDVPLAEIREMLEGQRTLAEGMSQQLERLRSRRADLEEAIGFCTLLQQENGPLEQLDVEQTLARLTAREEQGVTFVNIERTDQKTRRIRGACIGAALFVTMMAFVMAIMGWAIYTDPQDAPPLPLRYVYALDLYTYDTPVFYLLTDAPHAAVQAAFADFWIHGDNCRMKRLEDVGAAHIAQALTVRAQGTPKSKKVYVCSRRLAPYDVQIEHRAPA